MTERSNLKQAAPFRLAWWQHLLVLTFVVALIVSRRPDALTNPDFYAEDGAVWFADAWNIGLLPSLSLPAGGYLNTLPRLVAGLAVLFPLEWAPLLMNWCGILIQALPVSVLLSGRCGNWGPLWLRALQGLFYIALPNSSEVHANITNAHFHLVVTACLLAFSEAPRQAWWKATDAAVFLLTGLTGPWSLVLLPLTGLWWLLRRQRWSLVAVAILGVCAGVQSLVLHEHVGVRASAPLGASYHLAERILAGQVYMTSLVGLNQFALEAKTLPVVAVFVAGTGVLVYGLLRLRLEMKLFIAFAVLVTAAAMSNPLIATGSRWHVLAEGGAPRYWIFLILAVIWSLLWMTTQNTKRWLQAMAVALLLTTNIGIRQDWRHADYVDEHFGSQVRRFEEAQPGTVVTIPIDPPGITMKLLRR